MILRHKDLVIDPNDPFLNCKLDRKKYALTLTKLIEGFPEGFVLAINNEWGTGKTTFIKMWREYLSGKDFDTLYFNAWENDFESTPLIAILSELKELIGKNNKDQFKTLLSKGVTLTKSVIPLIIKSLVDNYVNSKNITDAIEKISEGAVNVLEEEVEEYAKKKKGLVEFRSELSKFLNNRSSSKPLIFFIDELDRCNPKYSVEVLENIKHFFSVNGVVFILSIDKYQLGNAVQGYYGSDKINSDAYLKRFIDLEFKIPSPDAIVCCRYFCDYFELDRFFKNPARLNFRDFQNEYENFIRFAKLIHETDLLSLRQTEKLFAHTRVVLTQFKSNYYVFPEVLFFLILVRDQNLNLYSNVRDGRLSLQEFTSNIEDILVKYKNDETETLIYVIAAHLIRFYYNQLREKQHKIKLIIKSSEDGTDRLSIETKFSHSLLFSQITSIDRERYDLYSLRELLKKVDLIDDILMGNEP